MEFLTGIDEEIARAKSLENYVIDKMEHCPNNNDCGNCADFCLQEALDHKSLYEWLEKLKEYVELEEQGLLPRFHLGDEFWVVSSCHRVSKAKIVMLQQKKNGTWKYRFCDEFSHTHDYEENELGKYFFSDKEGAEKRAEYEQERWEEQRKKLESMKGE
jgi:hypothetical protein